MRTEGSFPFPRDVRNSMTCQHSISLMLCHYAQRDAWTHLSISVESEPEARPGLEFRS